LPITLRLSMKKNTLSRSLAPCRAHRWFHSSSSYGTSWSESSDSARSPPSVCPINLAADRFYFTSEIPNVFLEKMEMTIADKVDRLAGELARRILHNATTRTIRRRAQS